MKQHLYLHHLMSLFAHDYLLNGGIKVFEQEIVLNPSIFFKAYSRLNNNGNPFFEYSFGMGYMLAKSAFIVVKEKFGDEITSALTSSFSDNDISHEIFLPYQEYINELDDQLEESLKNLKQLNFSAYDYWHRLFEYSYGFILLHELGHYLNGHLEYFSKFRFNRHPIDSGIVRELHIAELQSDIFATQILFNSGMYEDARKAGRSWDIPSFKKVGGEQWIECVCTSALIVFILLEKLSSSNNEIRTHPKPSIRIANCLRHIIHSVYYFDIKKTPLESYKFINEIIKKIEKTLNVLKIDFSNWIDIYSFTGSLGAFDRFIIFDEKSDGVEYFDLKIRSKDFRYKVGEYSQKAFQNVNSTPFFTSLCGLVTLSGNHIPWISLGSKYFVEDALKRIVIDDKRVIENIVNGSGKIVFEKLDEAKELHFKPNNFKNMNKIDIVAEVENLFNFNEEELFTKIGQDLIRLDKANVNSLS